MKRSIIVCLVSLLLTFSLTAPLALAAVAYNGIDRARIVNDVQFGNFNESFNACKRAAGEVVRNAAGYRHAHMFEDAKRNSYVRAETALRGFMAMNPSRVERSNEDAVRQFGEATQQRFYSLVRLVQTMKADPVMLDATSSILAISDFDSCGDGIVTDLERYNRSAEELNALISSHPYISSFFYLTPRFGIEWSGTVVWN